MRLHFPTFALSLFGDLDYTLALFACRYLLQKPPLTSCASLFLTPNSTGEFRDSTRPFGGTDGICILSWDPKRTNLLSDFADFFNELMMPSPPGWQGCLVSLVRSTSNFLEFLSEERRRNWQWGWRLGLENEGRAHYNSFNVWIALQREPDEDFRGQRE